MSRWVALAVGALALIVGGCSHEGPTPDEEQTTPTPTREEVFIERAHDEVPESRELDDDDLLAYGEAVCDALESGVTVEELGIAIGYRVQNVEVARMLGYIGGTAVITLCPEVLENGG